MKKTKKVIEEQTKPTSGVIYLEEGTTLAEVLAQVMAVGVTDFSKVRFDHDYVGCNGHPEGEYCYCPSSYTDERFSWEI